ncbi:hypothetical protein F4808DRAFT_432530 [Astrocystis sublimbata]|nr:hypothetical protein F4808DRAFT_432530 [Astrocystis sublimbata]
MALSSMKMLALPTLLLAGAAQALPSMNLKPRVPQPCAVTTMFPDGATYKPGDKITIEWSADGLPGGDMHLSLQSGLVTPIITGYVRGWNGQLVPTLDFKGGAVFLDPVPIENEKLEWTIEVVANSTGDEYQYYANGWYYTHYNPAGGDSSESCSTNNFHVSA